MNRTENKITTTQDFGAFLFPAAYNTDRTKPWVSMEEFESDPLYYKFADYRYGSAEILMYAAKFKELQTAISHHAQLITKDSDRKIIFVKAVQDTP